VRKSILWHVLIQIEFWVVAHAEDIGNELIAHLFGSKVLECHLFVIMVEGELFRGDALETEDKCVSCTDVGRAPVIDKVAVLTVHGHGGDVVGGGLHRCYPRLVLSSLVLGAGADAVGKQAGGDET